MPTKLIDLHTLNVKLMTKLGNTNFRTQLSSHGDYISVKGYDMEDAMILNKSSYERGFAHGTVIKCEVCTKISAVVVFIFFFITMPCGLELA